MSRRYIALAFSGMIAIDRSGSLQSPSDVFHSYSFLIFCPLVLRFSRGTADEASLFCFHRHPLCLHIHAPHAFTYLSSTGVLAQRMRSLQRTILLTMITMTCDINVDAYSSCSHIAGVGDEPTELLLGFDYCSCGVSHPGIDN